MTATILLIRHAAHDHLGAILSGRMPGLALSDMGREQACRLAERLAMVPLTRLETSPVQRALETAEAIAARGLAVEVAEALEEIDFGAWTGQSFAALADDAGWQAWNARRGQGVAPGGESMAGAQQRAWRHIDATASRCSGETVAMVTHCDIIRAVIVHILGLPLDAVHRFDIDPASVSRVAVGAWGARVMSLNESVTVGAPW